MSHADKLFVGWRRSLDPPEPVKEPAPQIAKSSTSMTFAIETVSTILFDFEDCVDQALTVTPPVLPQVPNVRRGFTDRVDFDHELGAALGGNTIYPDLEDLRENTAHGLDECGIVEVLSTFWERGADL
jgi:hypothetical protein